MVSLVSLFLPPFQYPSFDSDFSLFPVPNAFTDLLDHLTTWVIITYSQTGFAVSVSVDRSSSELGLAHIFRYSRSDKFARLGRVKRSVGDVAFVGGEIELLLQSSEPTGQGRTVD